MRSDATATDPFKKTGRHITSPARLRRQDCARSPEQARRQRVDRQPVSRQTLRPWSDLNRHLTVAPYLTSPDAYKPGDLRDGSEPGANSAQRRRTLQRPHQRPTRDDNADEERKKTTHSPRRRTHPRASSGANGVTTESGRRHRRRANHRLRIPRAPPVRNPPRSWLRFLRKSPWSPDSVIPLPEIDVANGSPAITPGQ